MHHEKGLGNRGNIEGFDSLIVELHTAEILLIIRLRVRSKPCPSSIFCKEDPRAEVVHEVKPTERGQCYVRCRAAHRLRKAELVEKLPHRCDALGSVPAVASIANFSANRKIGVKVVCHSGICPTTKRNAPHKETHMHEEGRFLS